MELNGQQFKQHLETVGRSEHPNVTPYVSGGIGHRVGDEARSVVGFLPTHLVKAYREHAGDWHGEDSRKKVDAIKADIESGKGITSPLMMEYDHKEKWGYVGEGNHRLQAAVEAGAKTVPVRVYGRSHSGAEKRGAGIGGPMTPVSQFHHVEPDYVPPEAHPDRFRYPL